jgi:glycosyltransferase involved in cell wall biosynthesis
MKKIFFWSPHINPQVATVKSVTNSLKSLIRYKKNFNLSLINVFGEWDQLNFKDLQKIDLLSDKKDLDKKKYKGFLNSRLLYLQIFFNSYIPLKKILKRDRPDFLIIHLITIVPILLYIFNKFETKLILRISGLPRLTLIRSFLWKLASKKIEYIICPTEETKKFLIKKKIFDSNKIIFIPDPIIEIKQINLLKRKIIDNKFKEPYFLCIGRFTKQKNHIFLLNFFLKNLHYLRDFKLIIIGDGELKNEYYEFTRCNKLQDKIKVLSYKNNVLNYIRNAKCVISCSLWEDPGFIMVEAAAVGTPIITSNCPNGPKEFIGKNENGFLFNSNDEKSFKDALDSYINSPKDIINQKLINAKKRAKIYTCFYNSKKLSNILEK